MHGKDQKKENCKDTNRNMTWEPEAKVRSRRWLPEEASWINYTGEWVLRNLSKNPESHKREKMSKAYTYPQSHITVDTMLF